MKYLCSTLCSLNSKFDELRDEIHEQKIKCENNFDELKEQNSDLKNDINKINKRFDNTNEIFESKFNELEQSIERMGVWRINTGKCSVNENNEEINDKVRSVVNTRENNGDTSDTNNGCLLYTSRCV